MTSKYASGGTEPVFEQYRVPTGDTGIEIHVRNKRPASMTDFRADRTIVMIHGATFSSGSLYDVPFNGMSFLDFLAAAS